MIEKICETCFKPFFIYPYRKDTAIYCSHSCNGKKSKTLFKKGHPQSNTGRTHFQKGRKLSKKHIEKIIKIHRKRLLENPIKNSGKTRFKKGNKNILWKGGQYPDKKGYIHVLDPKHPNADSQGYVKRANLMMEKIIGRFLDPREIVHHKGVHFSIESIENRQDDSPDNLCLFKNNSEHMKFHAIERWHSIPASFVQ